MKSKFKVLITMLLALTMVFSAFACRGRGFDPEDPDNPNNPNNPSDWEEPVDTAKTQLYVYNHNGGYGDQWIYALKERFEDFYKNESFEEGKKGVQIIVDNDKITGVALKPLVAGSRNDVFFGESIYYYDFISSGLMAEITDVVTGSLEEYGEQGTIEDKFYDDQKAFYKTPDGKYYGLPHYFAAQGIMYDIDLFDKMNFYFAADPNKAGQAANAYDGTGSSNNGNGGFIRNANDTKSNGPDGKPNTYDDGLPATYDEYFRLCDRIKQRGMMPVIWSGENQRGYNLWSLAGLTADAEGADQFRKYFSFDGQATQLVESVTEDGTVAGNVTFRAPVNLNLSNGYEMYRSVGRYYALRFWERLVDSTKNYTSEKCFTGTESQLLAQEDFLMSAPDSSADGYGQGSIAMLFDGVWWNNEADDVYAMASEAYGDKWSRQNRHIGFLPFPKPTKELVGTGLTIGEMINSVAFINKNVTGRKLDLAKKLLKFAYTDQSLQEFTVISSAPKSMRYELTPEQQAQLDPFAKNFWNLLHDENTEVVFQLANNRVAREKQEQLFVSLQDNFTSKIGNTEYNNPGGVLHNTGASHVSALDFFNGMANKYTQDWWNQLCGPFSADETASN